MTKLGTTIASASSRDKDIEKEDNKQSRPQPQLVKALLKSNRSWYFCQCVLTETVICITEE